MSGLHVHIDELVFEGFSPAESHRMAAALERELARLLSEQAEQGLPWTASAETFDAGQVRLAGSPERTGARIAAALLRG